MPSEELRPGDVVGLFGGRISSRTDGADQVLVVRIESRDEPFELEVGLSRERGAVVRKRTTPDARSLILRGRAWHPAGADGGTLHARGLAADDYWAAAAAEDRGWIEGWQDTPVDGDA